MRLSGVEVGDSRQVIETLIALAKTLPNPVDATDCEMRVAVSMYEHTITAEECALLFTLASEVDHLDMNIFVMIVAFVRYLERIMGLYELNEEISKRCTILGLVLEMCS